MNATAGSVLFCASVKYCEMGTILSRWFLVKPQKVVHVRCRIAARIFVRVVDLPGDTRVLQFFKNGFSSQLSGVVT